MSRHTRVGYLCGLTFGYLRVVEETSQRSKGGAILWRCVCTRHDVGAADGKGTLPEVLVMTHNLTSGNTISCGCVQVARTRQAHRQGIRGRDLDPRACEECGTVFQPSAKTDLTCSPVCRRDLANRRHREHWHARIDLTGQVFGRLSVLCRDPADAGRWECRCGCGGSVSVRTGSLTTQNAGKATRSCGCLKHDVQAARAADMGRAKLHDRVGQRYGRLYVLARAGRSGAGDARWLCRCDCGRYTATLGGCLRRGKTRSCGCLRDELLRARAREVGAALSERECRTCNRVFVAVGPQKDCGDECRLAWHARDEARRREVEKLGPDGQAVLLAIEMERLS